MSVENYDINNRPEYSNSELADITCFSNIGQIRELQYGKNPDNKNVITNITLHVVAQDWNKDNFISWAKKGILLRIMVLLLMVL